MQYMTLNVVPNTPTSQQPALITYDFTVFGIEYSSTGPTGGESGMSGYTGISGDYNAELNHYKYMANKLSKELRVFCKSFVFQCERCPTSGRPHFQGRLKCKNRLRLNQLIDIFSHNITKACRLSATSKENSKNFFYVTKEDTKICGPWKDTDNNGKELPWQLAMFPNDLDWQAQIRKLISVRELRVINCVILQQGAEGKTICCQKLVWDGLAEYLPYCDNHKDLMQAVYDCGEKPAYIFDLPRSLRKDKMRPFFAAVEDIKSGWCFDLRYEYRRELRSQPNLWIFTNKWPDIKYLSKDRWRFWKIMDNQLVPYSPEEINAAQAAIKSKRKGKKYPPKVQVPTCTPAPFPSEEWLKEEAARTKWAASQSLIPKVPTPPINRKHPADRKVVAGFIHDYNTMQTIPVGPALH